MYRVMAGSMDSVVYCTASVVTRVARQLAIKHGVCFVSLITPEGIANTMAFRVGR